MFLILFIVVPILEIYFLLKIGSIIGGANTIFVILLTAILGAYLVKQEGKGILKKLSFGLTQAKEPSDIILQGLCVFIGGVLLLTPGFLTDILGFSFVIPFTRKFCAKTLKDYFLKKGLKKGFVYSKFYSTKNKNVSTGQDSNVVDTTGVRIKTK